MKLTLLGTGCPSVDYKRCGSSNLVLTKKTKILVDCGSGVTQRLNQSKNSSADIDALLLTHLHTDHVDGGQRQLRERCLHGGEATDQNHRTGNTQHCHAIPQQQPEHQQRVTPRFGTLSSPPEAGRWYLAIRTAPWYVTC